MGNTEQMVEYMRCLDDVPYALRTYNETFDKTQNKFVPFELFTEQEILIHNYEDYRFNLVVKYRQAGITTVTAGYCANKVVFGDPENPEKILIIANKQDTAFEFLDKIKSFMEQYPLWCGIGKNEEEKKNSALKYKKESQKHLKIENKAGELVGEVKAVATSLDALRGYTPTILILDEAAYIEGGQALWAACLSSLGTGGKAFVVSCVTADTYIFTDKGIKQIKDFINPNESSTYTIPEYKILGKNNLRSGVLFHDNGLVDTIKITALHGWLEGSTNHKVYAFSNKDKKYDWYKFNQLELGDYVSFQYGMNIWGSNDDVSDFKYMPSSKEHNYTEFKTITTDLAYFLGMFLAEGSIYKKIVNEKHTGTAITLTCGDDISHVFNNIGLNFSSHDKLHYTASSKMMGAFLEYLGFDLSLTAKNKVIPSRLLEMSRENLRYFLRGMFDGDGYSRKDTGTIGIGLSSKKMVEQIRIILNNFGILTDYLEYLTPPTKKVKVSSLSHRICINKTFSKVFYNEIGFGFDRKQLNLNNLKIKEGGHVDNLDIIPNGKYYVQAIYDLLNRKVKILKENKCYINNYTSNVSRAGLLRLIKFAKTINNSPILNEFEDIINEKTKWVAIKKITHQQNNTYDFSLPNNEDDFWCHSVVYNGIVGHQTPQGMDELYYRLYAESINGVNSFKIFQMYWYDDPRYNKELYFVKYEGHVVDWLSNEETKANYETKPAKGIPRTEWDDLFRNGWKPCGPWFENMSRELNFNKNQINQELLGEFLGSGDSVVDPKIIEKQEIENVVEPIRKELEQKLWIWQEPIKGHKYIIGIDVSRGDSEDFSSFNIIDFDEMEQVVEYKAKLPPDILAEIVFKWAHKYTAFAVVDITGGMGVATSRKLQELSYPNTLLYYDGIKDMDRWKYGVYDDKIPGINYNNKRAQIIQAFEEKSKNRF